MASPLDLNSQDYGEDLKIMMHVKHLCSGKHIANTIIFPNLIINLKISWGLSLIFYSRLLEAWRSVLRMTEPLFKKRTGTSLAVQWLTVRASTSGSTGSIPGREAKIPHATWCCQINKHEENNIQITIWLRICSNIWRLCVERRRYFLVANL